MIAVDTNVLVYAHRTDSPFHEQARTALAGLVESRRSWAVPWPCLHEFLAIVTHQRIYRPPTTAEAASRAVGDLIEMQGLVLLGESARHWSVLRELISRTAISGPRVHDARIAAICLGHGVDELWTADRDFSWFPELTTRNPLVG